MRLLNTLEHSLRSEAAVTSGDRLLVAFSGGPDSSALLWGLTRLAGSLGVELLAAHLDHRLDPDSPRRAAAASRLAATLAVPFFTARLDPAACRPTAGRRGDGGGGESVEAWARRHRYAFLNRLAAERRARFLLTAHHADDQAETVLLRLLYGSGLEGLAGIHSIDGRLVRPLLGLRRRQLSDALAESGLEPVDDPTNSELDIPRNRVRHRLLPELEARDPRIVGKLCALARTADAARKRGEEMLAPALGLQVEERGRGAALDRRALENLPAPLLAPALGILGRRAHMPYPSSAAARGEFLRQLRDGGRIGCDCGHGWQWEGDEQTIRLVPGEPKVGHFAYTLGAPGEVEVPEIDVRVRLRRGRVEPWMFQGCRDRAALALPHPPGDRIEIRNRRPGDRIQPLGGKTRLRLKELLIARRTPRHRRDRLPLLLIDGLIAWVPGVTIDERFRLKDENTTWIAEFEPLDTVASGDDPVANGDRQER